MLKTGKSLGDECPRSHADTIFQSSLRDSGDTVATFPWVETHGYHQAVALRPVAAFGAERQPMPN